MSALHPVLGSPARHSYFVIVCTSAALEAQVAYCVEPLDLGEPICRCLPTPAPQVVGPPELHLRQLEPPTKTALLNYIETIRLEARPPRPHVEI